MRLEPFRVRIALVAPAPAQHRLPLALLAGEHEDRRLRGRADAFADIVAAQLREAAIEDDEMRQLVGMTPERGLAVVGGEQVVPLGAEERRDHAGQRTVVVDDEHAGHQSAPPSGMLNANTLPVLPLTWSSYQRLPPWASTTRRQEKRPMPAPDTSSLPKRTNGSKIRRRASGGTPGPSPATRTIARSFPLPPPPPLTAPPAPPSPPFST